MPSRSSAPQHFAITYPEIITSILLFCHQDDVDPCNESNDHPHPLPSSVSSASLISKDFYRISRQILFHTPIIRIPSNGHVSSPSIIESTPQLSSLFDIIQHNPNIVRSFKALKIRFQVPHNIYSPSSPWSLDGPLTETGSTSHHNNAPLIPILQHIARHASLSSITLRGITPRVGDHKTQLFDTLNWLSLSRPLRTAILDIIQMDTVRTIDIQYFVDFPVAKLWASSHGDGNHRMIRRRRLGGMEETRPTRVSLHYVSCLPASPNVLKPFSLTLPRLPSSSTIVELHINQHPYTWQNLTHLISNAIQNGVVLSPFRAIRHLSFAIPARRDDFALLLLQECGEGLESLNMDCGYSVLTTVFPDDAIVKFAPDLPHTPFQDWKSRFTLHNLQRIRHITFQTGVYPSTLVRGIHSSQSSLTLPLTEELFEDWNGIVCQSPTELTDIHQVHLPPDPPRKREKKGYKRAYRSPIPWISHILSTIPQHLTLQQRHRDKPMDVIVQLDVTKVRRKVNASLDWGEFAGVMNRLGGTRSWTRDVTVSAEIQVHALIPELSVIAATLIEGSESLKELRELGVMRVVPV